MGLATALWRAVAVYRVAALGYAAVLMVSNYHDYAHPVLGWCVLAVMTAWTIAAAWAYRAPHRRRWLLYTVDLLVTAGCLLSSRVVVPADLLRGGSATLTMAWVAAPVLAYAIGRGRRWAGVAALVLGGLDLSMRGSVSQAVFNGTALLLLSGMTLAYLARLAFAAEERMQQAIELEAATRERERLARGIHDGVLQVLALVQRRGAEIGGAAAELGRLAGEQEATLRSLVGMGVTAPGPADGSADLRTLLRPYASARVSIAAPATPVLLGAAAAADITAAVASALDNVAAHAGDGARAWVLVEDERDAVTVTVRDDGPGFAPGRLPEAAAAGRLGIAQSIRGRIRDLGGEVVITAGPGQGVEVEMRVPRPRAASSRAAGAAVRASGGD